MIVVALQRDPGLEIDGDQNAGQDRKGGLSGA